MNSLASALTPSSGKPGPSPSNPPGPRTASSSPSSPSSTKPDTSDTCESSLAFSLPDAPVPAPDNPDDLAGNIARRVLASLDRLAQIAEASERYMTRNELKPKDLADMIVASGNLREKHVLASSKVLGEVMSALKKKKAVVEA